MTARFRFHRGTLEESLSTEVTVESLSDIEALLGPEWEKDGLMCRMYCRDDRDGGYPYTYVVTGSVGGHRLPVGFCDAQLLY